MIIIRMKGYVTFEFVVLITSLAVATAAITESVINNANQSINDILLANYINSLAYQIMASGYKAVFEDSSVTISVSSPNPITITTNGSTITVSSGAFSVDVTSFIPFSNTSFSVSSGTITVYKTSDNRIGVRTP